MIIHAQSGSWSHSGGLQQVLGHLNCLKASSHLQRASGIGSIHGNRTLLQVRFALLELQSDSDTSELGSSNDGG